MNAETSQEVFVGPYLDDPAERARFSEAFAAMTSAFLAFPLCLPGAQRGSGVRVLLATRLRCPCACERSLAGARLRCPCALAALYVETKHPPMN